MGSGISTKYDKTEGLKSFEKTKTNKNVVIEVQNTMPCYKEAYTDPKKFYEYSLDDTNINGVDKAIHYKKSLGFDKTNPSYPVFSHVDDNLDWKHCINKNELSPYMVSEAS